MDVIEIRAAAQIFGRGVLTPNLTGEANGSLAVNERHVDRSFKRSIVVPAIVCLYIAVEFVAGRFRTDQHGPTQSVPAEQRTLRPFENLNTGDVIGRDIRAIANQRDVRDRKSTRLNSSH